MNPASWTILGYFTLVAVIGVYLSKRNKSSEDWATASSSMGVLLIAAGIAGTRIGGAGSYGVAGDVMKTGIWNVWYGVTTFLALALVGVFFAVPYRRLKLTTISELFIRRFGSARSRVITSLCVQTEYLVINIIEPLVIGLIVSKVVGIPLIPSIYLGSLVIIISTSTSGLRGTAFTNVIHCSVIIFGLASVGIIAANQLGGWSSVVEKANNALGTAEVDTASWWSFIGLGWFPIIAMFFSATIHTPAASIYVNYSTSARHESVLIPAFLLAGAIAALMPFLSAIIGIEAVAKYGFDSGITGYNSVTQIATDAGPFIGGIALAAVLAALISSGGPILLASSTMFINDWVPNSKDFLPEKKLKYYRTTSVVYGLFVATLACFLPISSVLKLLLLGFAMVVPPAIAVTYILYWKKTTERGAFWGTVLGYGTGVAAWVGNELFFHSETDLAAYFTTLIPIVVVPVVSLMTQPASGVDRLSDEFYRTLRSTPTG